MEEITNNDALRYIKEEIKHTKKRQPRETVPEF
jgi:hypothetical protein